MIKLKSLLEVNTKLGETPKGNWKELKSVGHWFDPQTGNTYPAFKDGTYDKANKLHISEWDTYRPLSQKDLSTILGNFR